MVNAIEIAEFLNKELKINDIEDRSCNGLQMENEGEISKVGFAVDASLETFQKATESGCQMVIVHHGMIWEGIKYIKGHNYKRIKHLIRNNLALYAAHLPLDRHDTYGHNIIIANLLELKDLKPFGFHNDKTIGFMGNTDTTLEEIERKLTENHMKPKTYVFGKKNIRKVAIVSGAGKSEAIQAVNVKADLYITGEDAYKFHWLSRENKINIICAGHYATEVFGVKALMQLVKEKFNVDVEFIDVPVPI